MDDILLNVTTSGSQAVGGYVDDSNGYSTDPTTGITDSGGLDKQYSFVDFDLTDLPSYAITALQNGQAQMLVQFTTSTSNISAVTVKAYAAPDDLNVGAISDFIADPSKQTASYTAEAFDSNSSNPIDTVSVRHSFGPAVPSENENVAQSINVTQAALAAIADGANLVVYFSGSGGVAGASTNITNVTANVLAYVPEPDNFSNSTSTILLGLLPSGPFQNAALTSVVPTNLIQNTGSGSLTINYQPSNPTSTLFIDKSVATQGTEYFEIVQSNSATGVLSGVGLMQSNQYVKSGQTGYLLSGTAASVTAELQGLVFTPAAGAGSAVAATTFTLSEFNAGIAGAPGGVPVTVGSVQVFTGSATGTTVGGLDNSYNENPIEFQIVNRGGTADGTTLSGFGDENGIHEGTLTVSSGGTASGTYVEAGNVYVSAGGLSIATTLGGGGVFGINSDSSTTNETVYDGGTASSTTIGDDAMQTVSSGAIADGSIIQNGGVQNVFGTASGTNILSGGTETISAGAFGVGTLVSSGGRQTDAGTVTGAVVAGTQVVAAGGTASNTSVLSGGGLLVQSGGHAVSATLSGGTALVTSGGTVSGLVLSGGSAVLNAGATASGTITFAGIANLEIDAPTSAGTSFFHFALQGLAPGDSIDLTTLGYTSASTASLSGDLLTVTNGAATEYFQVLNATASSVMATFDGNGETEIMVPLSNTGIRENSGPVAPLIVGGGNTVANVNGRQASVQPFHDAQVSDPNYGATEVVTIQISDGGASGTLSGPGLTAGKAGQYVLSGLAQAVSSDLEQLKFQASAGQPNSSVKTIFTITDTSTAGPSASDAGYTVTIDTAAAKPVVTGSSSQAVTSETPVTPFASAVVTDPDANSTEVVTIDFNEPPGQLSGTGLSVVQGKDTLTGTAAQVTSELQALVFTPYRGTPNASETITFTVTDVVTVGLRSNDGKFTVTNSDPAIVPRLSGSASLSVTSEAASQPFATATLADPDGGSTDTLTITLSGGGGTLSGTGLTGNGTTYTLSGSATDVTNALQALSFVPAATLPGLTQTTDFALADTNTPGLTASDSAFSVADSDSVACYCRGTRILTDQGEVAVEALAIGDHVITASGAAAAIRWIGRRSYAGRFLAGRAHLLPILFRAGSLGDGVPRRDLRVSPLHAMMIDGLLIPARCLVNGTTVVQHQGCTRADYYHVELDHHDVLLAEGAGSESFVDDDSRGMFHNAAEWAAAYPGRTRVAAVYCAPRVESGFILEAIRRRLTAHAPARLLSRSCSQMAVAAR